MEGHASRPVTVTYQLQRFLDRYRVQASVAMAVVTILAFIAAEVFEPFQSYISSHGIVQYLVLLVTLDVAVAVHAHQRSPDLWTAKNQDESMPRLVESVSKCHLDRIDLLEYAGATTLPLIREVCRHRVPVRILVKHPDTVAGLQRHRMVTTLDTLFNSVFDEKYGGQVEIKCYRMPYGLRGRRLGKELLEVGWLTPDLKRMTAYGHANPSLLADVSTRQNEHLRDFFDRTFNDIWTAPDTEDALQVLLRLAAEGTPGVTSRGGASASLN